MKRATALSGSLLLAALFALGPALVKADNATKPVGAADPRIQRGYDIAPVPLDLAGKDPDLVGLGSYIVNAQTLCADCHSCPTYAPGHNPFLGQPKQFNKRNYLAGGVPFGPIVSANITPDADGKPAGLTFDEYLRLIRTGHDPEDPDEIIQVMPWPFYQSMLTHDIRAVYEYLRAVPPAVSGTECTGPGQ